MASVLVAVGVLMAGLVGATHAAPDPEAIVEWEVVVPAAEATTSYVEPALAVHPSDPRLAIAAAIAVDSTGRWSVTALRSADTGRTWEHRPLPAMRDAQLEADPWLAWLGSRAYLARLIHRRTEDGRERALVYVHGSNDGGVGWGDPTLVPYESVGSFDRPVIDGLLRAGRDSIVAVFATPPCVTRSGDGGVHFPPPRPLIMDQRNNIMGCGLLALDGTTVMTWMTLEDSPRAPLLVARGDSAESLTISVLDSAAVWRGASILAADRDLRSPRVGALYATWTGEPDARPGTQDVRFAASRDSGRSWSKPVTLSGAGGSGVRGIPFLAVSPSGVVGVTWFEGMEGACGRAVFRASPDGGHTWTNEASLTKVVSCPEQDRRGSIGVRWPFGSDYGALAASPDESFLAAWSDASEGIHRIRVARIRVRFAR